MHQAVDDGCGQRVVDIEDLAPFTEDAIGRDDDRAAFIASGHDLEHQVGPPLVDGQIPLFVTSSRAITPIQESTLYSCLKQNELPYGFIINFNASRLNQGICRIDR